VLQLLPGDGALGAALVEDARVRGVLFTGSTEVARAIQQQLAGRLDARGMPIPLIAETGGQNAMVVDSSALPEQAVADIIASAFDSAGQRCSALRILLVQEEIAPRLMTMLRGALAEFCTGRPDHLATDMGPMISAQARETVARHVSAMRQRGFQVFSPDPGALGQHGFFIAPTVIEIPSIDVLGREVFGPVLHVLRYRRSELERRIAEVNALGYALTFGIHSRIDETIRSVCQRIHAGNIYVNRNIIGAVVGVQPFGGHGLSGTGPKAGGPLYLRRLLAELPAAHGLAGGIPRRAFQDFIAFLHAQDIDTSGFSAYGSRAPAPSEILLPGPVGEQNQYRLLPRGRVLCHAATAASAWRQIAASLATGNVALVQCAAALPALQALPDSLASHIQPVMEDAIADVALFDGDAGALRGGMAVLAAQRHAVMAVYPLPRDQGRDGDYPLELLMTERSVSTNTAASGGNASLMMISG
jgi:RHH-type proline utilization regulon transcriptional repressor/proline dehydrogenase/delta 1-pyrroline-5-carboxylate dehydrogenase